MAFPQGAVLVLPFPYGDRLAEKRRPAVVVSKPALERASGLIWVAMITSDRGRGQRGDVPISRLASTGLTAASVVRPAKLATIEPARVLRQAGVLPRADIAAVLAFLSAHL